MSDDKQLQKTDEQQHLQSVDDSAYSTFLDTNTFNQTWRAATLLSKSDLVPQHYKNKPENCFLAFTAARRVNADPFVFMQKTFVIGGKLGMESQYMIAMVNTKGPFTGPIQWKMEKSGDRIIACTAYATHKITGEKCEATVTAKMVEAEGWSKKSGSKWLSLPELMFKYRSAAFLARLYCPEVLFGMRPADELEDIEDNPIPERKRPESDLNERLSRKVDSTVKEDEKRPEPEPEPDVEAKIDTVKADDTEPEAETPPEAAQGGPESTNVLPEERYYCNDCGRTGARLTASGKMPGCLHSNVIDRMNS